MPITIWVTIVPTKKEEISMVNQVSHLIPVYLRAGLAAASRPAKKAMSRSMARTGRGELRAKTFARIRPNSPNWTVALKAALRSRFSRAILKDREIAAASKIRDVAKKRSKGVS
jgi:hypothetical protein